MSTKSALGLAFILSLSTACASSSDNGPAPNEFRVVKKAPLTVPPEYSLRPPEAGTVRPVELDPARVEQSVTFGEQVGSSASLAERVLVARAGAIAVSPIVREQVDYEEAGLLRKSRSISDRVTGWTGSEEELAEAESDSATGGGEITIERSSGPRIKLPGT